MRHGRAKAARKTLQFFARQGFRPPYCVLLDGTFLVLAVQQKVSVWDRVSKLLQHAPYTLHMTRSTLQELEMLAKQVPQQDKRDEFQQARQWGLDECNVIRDIPKREEVEDDTKDLGIPAQDVCRLLSHSHYVVATQDDALLEKLRNMGRCPLLRLSRGVLLLENPSKQAQLRATRHEHQKYSAPKEERLLAESVLEQERTATTSVLPTQQQQQQQRIKKPKAKGPNPLSCKVSKKKQRDDEKQSSAPKRKRRRKSKP